MEIREIFSNRELSLLIWIGIAFIAMLFSNSLRNSLLGILKMFFQKTFLIIYILLTIYLSGIIFLLLKLHLWNIGNIKDTLFWLFIVGFVLIFNITKAKDSNYFKTVFFEGLKWTVILEFIVNFYSFSLITELILIPVLVFIGLTHAVSELDKKNIQVTKLLSNVLNIVGWVIFCYAIYKTVYEYQSFFTFDNFTSFLFPIIITTLFIPFIYCFALYSAYETFFIRLDFMTTEETKVKQVKRLIQRIANISLDKLNRIMKRFEKKVFYENTDLKSYIHSISMKDKKASYQ